MNAHAARTPLVARIGRPRSDDPTELVRHLRTEVVVEALVADLPHAYVEFGNEVFFRCPVCHHRDFNCPSARLEEGWKWRCVQCDHVGTRYELEQFLLASPAAVLNMLRLIVERES